jgi:predicted regulator of Ras-like GTPase activity (Roadblock/LC7/MglB family)
VANVEGAACAAVFRLDGEVVDTYTVDSAFPLGRAGPDVGVLTKVSSYLARKINAGSLEYCVVSAEKFILVLSAVEIDYALVIGLRQGGNLGKARLQMKKNLERVAAHLRSLVP